MPRKQNTNASPQERKRIREAAARMPEMHDQRTPLDGSVTNGKIPAYEIQNGRLATNSNDGRTTMPGSLNGGHLEPFSIFGGRLADGAADGRVVAAGSLEGGHLQPFSIFGGRLADNAVDGRALALLSVGAGHIRVGVIDTTRLDLVSLINRLDLTYRRIDATNF